MKLFIHEKENTHYFYVMGWDSKDKRSAPVKRNKFDIYEDAVEFFKHISKVCEFVQMFEYIGGKRKWIADTDNTLTLEHCVAESLEDEISRFEKETGLRLRHIIRNDYGEISGKTLIRIKRLVSEYNKKHGTNIYAYNDSNLDRTVIVF